MSESWHAGGEEARPVRPETQRRSTPPPRFVTGSLLHHILVMTGTGAVGLMAIFAGDLVNMIFLGLLRDDDVIAAVGYASSILFFTISIGIGLSIAATSLVSPQLGAGKRVMARRLSGSAHLLTVLVGAVLAVLVFACTPYLLRLLGAEGRAFELAAAYLRILVPFMVPLALGMTASAVLRSLGDAKRAMYVTLGGAILNAILDPIFIFVLGLGIEGAAIASAISRFAVMGIGLYGVVVVHDMLGRPSLRRMRSDARDLAVIAIPAVLTNVATPVGNAFVTATISAFGVGAVAGWAIVGRILPVAFGAIYALSGSVGPILGQNYGARDFQRMRQTLRLSLIVMLVFTLVAWAALALFTEPLVAAFHASGEAADLIRLFCRWLAPLFAFMGGLFIANASFNTLGRARLSSVLNWGRATLGTLPIVAIGGNLAGAAGVLAGNMLGGIPFGAIAVWLSFRHVRELEAAEATKSRDKRSNSSL